MKHIISFAGYDETIDWHIVEVNQALATLQLEVRHQEIKLHQMTLPFSEYDRFAREFRIVHEQLPGIVFFEKGDFTFELFTTDLDTSGSNGVLPVNRNTSCRLIRSYWASTRSNWCLHLKILHICP